MDKRILLKAALSVSLCIPLWGGGEGWLTPQAKGQAEAFPLGNKWADMFQPSTSLTVSDLQETNAALRYNGLPASKAQHVRTDEDGQVLFFVVDGNLYDGEGYLIADAKADGCSECLEIGVMEMLAIPAPGQCDKYFLFSMNAATNSGADLGLQIAILDLAGENPHWPGHRGRLMNVLNEEMDFIPVWEDWNIMEYDDVHTSEFVGSILGDAGMKSSTPILRAIAPDGSGDLYWLYVITTLRVTQFRIDANGVQLVPTEAGNYVPTYSDQSNWGLKPRYRDASVCASGGQVRLALTNCGLHGWSEEDGLDADDDAILVMRFNSNTGAFISSEGIDDGTGGLPEFTACDVPDWPAPGIRGGANGIAWISAGNKLLITGDSYENGVWSPRMGVFDLVAQQWTDLLGPMGVQDAENYVRSRLYRNTEAGGTNAAIYIPHADGLAMITGVEPGSYAWVPQVPFSQGVNVPLYVPEFPGAYTSPRFLNADVVNDPHIGFWQDPASECCVFQETFLGHPGSAVTVGNTFSTPWTPGNNPYGGAAEVIISSDLVIDNSIDLFVEGMTFRFAPTARLIIKPGAYARFTNCTLTGYNCANARWPGIRVNGNSAMNQSDQNDAQGRLHLDNTNVSNAVIGVRCATESTGGEPDPNGYGGVLWSVYSNFHNNIVGAELGNYHANFNDQNVEDNRSYFHYTFFGTNNAWPDNSLPIWHLKVLDTRKVNVFYCTFANDASNASYAGLGNGLYAWKSEVYVKGPTNSNPTFGYVRNLRTGIIKEGGPLEPITVDRMRFSGNRIGIDDVGGHFTRYVNNTFSVPDVVSSIKRIGIKLNQSRFFTVERNSFTGSLQASNTHHWSVGIWFLGILPDQTLPWVYDDEEIYDNDFTDLHTGCLVNGIHRSADGGPYDVGLQIYCGDYLNNTEDIGIGPQSIIRPNQFVLGFEPQLAGNRFLDAADCTSNYDWLLDPEWKQGVVPFQEMVITYLRNEDPLCEATCPDPATDDFVDLWATGSGPWLESEDCDGGNLDLGRSRSMAEADYATARTLCLQAKSLLDGLTDGGDKPDLLTELQQREPWLGSGFLRDRLLLNSPLSNDVLRAMIERGQPMDQWHITQVCIQNSPLDEGILGLLAHQEVLGVFFHNMVRAAQEGLGPSVKQLLTQEYMLRRGQQAESFADLGWLWATDTVQSGGNDSLLANLAVDAGLDHRWERMAMALHAGDMAAAATLEGALRDQNGFLHLQHVIDMGIVHGGNWSLLDSAEVDSLISYALSGLQGAALYESILEGHNLADVETEAIFPNKFRSAHTGEEGAGATEVEYAITVYPTPADRSSWLTYPSELTGTAFSIQDLQGRAVKHGRFIGGGVMELDCSVLANGLYSIMSSESSAIGRLLVER